LLWLVAQFPAPLRALSNRSGSRPTCLADRSVNTDRTVSPRRGRLLSVQLNEPYAKGAIRMTTHLQTTDLTRDLGIRLVEQWTAIWNGDLALAPQILTPDFRIHFASVGTDAADAFRGPADIASFIGEFRDRYPAPGLRYAMDGVPVVDPGSATVVARWTVDVPDATGAVTTKSGIDMLALDGDRIAEVWSVTGARRFAP
jgi:hypothetical protein